jgi:hypothetical protein
MSAVNDPLTNHLPTSSHQDVPSDCMGTVCFFGVCGTFKCVWRMCALLCTPWRINTYIGCIEVVSRCFKCFSISLQVVVIVRESATAAQTHSQVPFWAHPFPTGLFLHPDIWDPKNRSNTKPLGWYFKKKCVKLQTKTTASNLSV